MSARRSIDCALLVSSCDAYSDLWTPFFTLLSKHWPDVPFPIYLGTGCSDFRWPGVSVLNSPRGADWSTGMIDYLRQIDESFVLVCLEDFFLRRRVNTAEILYCLNFAKLNDAIQVRLIPRPEPQFYIQGQELIGECEVGSPYRLNTQAAIWRKQALIDLLRAGETIWNFEKLGNARVANVAHGLYSVWRPVLPYQGLLAHHVVEKGKWLRHERWLFGRMGIGCDFRKRKAMSARANLEYLFIVSLDRLISTMPWRTGLRIKAAMKRVAAGFRAKVSPSN